MGVNYITGITTPQKPLPNCKYISSLSPSRLWVCPLRPMRDHPLILTSFAQPLAYRLAFVKLVLYIIYIYIWLIVGFQARLVSLSEYVAPRKRWKMSFTLF